MADDIRVRLSAEWDAAVGARSTPPVSAVIEAAEPETASRTAVLAELAETRLLLSELRESVEMGGDEQRLVTPRWTIRDIVAHLASWARETRHEIATIRRKDTFDYTIHFEREGGPRAWNQREIDARSGRTLGDLFDEFDAETARLEDMVIAMPEEELRNVIELPRTSGEPPIAWRLGLAALLVRSCWHVRYHLAGIERARSRSAP